MRLRTLWGKHWGEQKHGLKTWRKVWRTSQLPCHHVSVSSTSPQVWLSTWTDRFGLTLDSLFCFSQDKKEDKTRLLTWEESVLVKKKDIFCKNTGEIVNTVNLLLTNQHFFSFNHPVALLVLVFGPGPPEEDEQIGAVVLTEGGKAASESFSPAVDLSRSATLCMELSLPAVCVSGSWQRHWLHLRGQLPPRKTNDGQLYD